MRSPSLAIVNWNGFTNSHHRTSEKINGPKGQGAARKPGSLVVGVRIVRAGQVVRTVTAVKS
jgi:hypothetical protein